MNKVITILAAVMLVIVQSSAQDKIIEYGPKKEVKPILRLIARITPLPIPVGFKKSN